MHERSIVGAILLWIVTGCLPAQSFATSLEDAAACIAEKEWKEAFEILIGLQEKATTDDERGQLAKQLFDLGGALRDESVFGEALRAHELAFAQRRRIFGDRDHSDLATSLNNVAKCLDSLGRLSEALPQFEAALAMRKRLYGDRDHPAVAESLNNVARCLESLDHAAEALPLQEAALAMVKRRCGDRDDRDVAAGLHNVAHCLKSLGRPAEALPLYEAALAMLRRLCRDRDDPDVARILSSVAACLYSLERASEALPDFEATLTMLQRLHGDRDRPDVAESLSSVGACLYSLERASEALPNFEAALAMSKRLCGGRDHSSVTTGLRNVALCLGSLGRASEALVHFEAALAMWKRLYGDRDHPVVAGSLNDVARCLESLGRASEGLSSCEAALAMQRRLYQDRDHWDVVLSLNNVAMSLESLGRASEALPNFEAALAMSRRLCGDRDHPDVARTLNNLASCLGSLGRVSEALPRHEAALAMFTRLFRDRDHPDVAGSLNNLANCLGSLGRVSEELPRFEAALAMWKRLCGDRDHPNVAKCLSNLASCLGALGRASEALSQSELALAMRKRLYGDRDHPDMAVSMHGLGLCLKTLGRTSDALPLCAQACDMIERLREGSHVSADVRQSFFDELKRGGAFELLQALANPTDVPLAIAAAERSRGRELIDQLEQQRFDPLEEAERRARVRGDERGAERLLQLRRDLDAVHLDDDRLLHLLTSDDSKVSEGEREARRAALLQESNALTVRKRQLLDERARLLGDVLPVGRVRTAAEIQAALRPGELLLEFTVSKEAALLYVLAHDGAPTVVPLPAAFATAQRALPRFLARSSREQVRGRDSEPTSGAATNEAADAARELFRALVPAPVWERVQQSRRVFVAAHRELHRLPFEMLVTGNKDGQPVHWLDSGPAVAYVPSGSALVWLRQRGAQASDDATALDFVGIADPSDLAAEPEVPQGGAFVLSVPDGSEGARVGLLPRDVLLRYDGTTLVDDTTLRDACTRIEAAIEDGKRADTPIVLEVWRRGATLRLEVKKGKLGIEVGRGKARAAFEASLGSDARTERVLRAGDLERLRQLPPLKGARTETAAIEKVFADRKAKTKRLLGADATEPALFDLAAKAKYLHFACHGVAEEYAGQSLSMLVLSQPQHVLPGDDGLLKLGDLLHHWRGRLASTRLVVLSACRTNVGPTLRDEAPQALPLGFLFAGAPAVISSLWAVDDASTKELMVDFYSRLLAGETDQLAAFTAAKKALRAKYPDPFHWAPFLYMGVPE